MTTVPPAYRVPLPDPLTDLLGKHLPDLPAPELDLTDGQLNARTADRYRAVLAETPDAWALIQHLRDLLDDDQGEGFAVLTTAPLLDHHGLDDGRTAITAVLSWLATPLKAYANEPLWNLLDSAPQPTVDDNPLHIDAICAARPPDYTAFLCTRPDPRRGGLSLVSPTHRAVSRLTDDERLLLTDRIRRPHEPKATTGTGPALDVFSVLEDTLPSADTFVRFHPSILKHAAPDDPHTHALHALKDELTARQRRMRLDFGDLLITNQHLCAHGHSTLSGFQNHLPPHQRRQMWRIHLRTNTPAS
ncbi:MULTISPECIES: TauD/TfdA family dioxygenase [unclassified Streptomyces]|uniref:TauD/TfdA family dioxygenase n=1 Tax=unclassified Streptomyces TaxID=2593676 RepID=UPI000DD5CE9B|nr:MULTISPECIES: TauD/TfdA family dioxygenase [unclassified Streptomyces]QZZ25600.1 TauD/TfdA family dioxygenase [Streptomyces sp. ST1015]